MRRFTLSVLLALFTIAGMAAIQVASVATYTTTAACYDIAVSPDGNTLYVAEQGANTIRTFNAKTLEAGSYLAAPATANTYGGGVAVDANGAIYGTYAIISKSSSVKIFKWSNSSATPIVFKDLGTASTYGIDNNPYRAGYALDVRVDANGNGFLLYPVPYNGNNGEGASVIYIPITNNTAGDPQQVVLSSTSWGQYPRVHIISDTQFWYDGNTARPYLVTIAKDNNGIVSYQSSINFPYKSDPAIMLAGNGVSDFSFKGTRYAVLGTNNHGQSTGYVCQNRANLYTISVGASAITATTKMYLPEGGMGTAQNSVGAVPSAVYNNGKEAWIYTAAMGIGNKICAFKMYDDADPTTLSDVLSGKTIRRSVYYNGAFYVLAVDNDKNPYLYKVNAETKEIDAVLPTDFCSVSANGFYKLSDIAVTSDGVLVGCNNEKCAFNTTAGSDLKFYKWDLQNFIGSLWFSVTGNNGYASGNFSNGYSGATMAYNGSFNSGTIAWRVQNVTSYPNSKSRYRYYTITNGSPTTCTRSQDIDFMNKYDADVELVAAPTTGHFVFMSSTQAPIEYSFKTDTKEPYTHGTFGTTSGIHGITFFTANAHNYMTVPSASGVKIYDVTSGLSSASLEATLTYNNTATYRTAYGFKDGDDFGAYLLVDDNIVKLPVTTPADNITLNKSSVDLPVNGTVTLVPTITPTEAAGNTITWESETPSVATVSDAGLVTAKALGTTTITATVDGHSASCTINVCPPVAHIYAYDLSRELSTVDYSTYTFKFKANTNAPAGGNYIVFYKESDGSEVDKIAIDGAIAAGVENAIQITKEQLPACDEPMTWAVELTGADSKVVGKFSDDSEKFIFYTLRGIAANVYPETDGFGNIYVNMPQDGDSGGGSETSRNQKMGIFQYDAALNLKNTTNAGYKGGLTWPNSAAPAVTAPYRVAISEDGLLYVSGNTDSHKGVWELSSPDASEGIFRPVISDYKTHGLCLTGVGADKKLYVVEEGTVNAITRYNIGNSVPYSGAGSVVSTCANAKVAYSYTNLETDGKEGFWIYEWRSADQENSSYVTLSHLNSEGTKDFDSFNPSLGLDDSRRGGFAVNATKDLMACGTAAKVTIFSIGWSNNNNIIKPVLTKLYEIPIGGNNIDGITFDYANNLYVVSSTSEFMYAYALPMTGANTSTVPAKKALTVTKTVNVPVTGVALDLSELNLLVGASQTLTATISPTTPPASDQVVTWTTTNADVATVSSSGEVTAQGVGNATITVTTHDGGLTATCAVTVTKVEVTSVNLNHTALDLPLGGKTTLAATVVPDNASYPSVTWSSSDDNKATVSSTGLVTAKAAGSVTITATADGVSGTCEITVHAPVAHIYAYDLNSEIVGDNYELSFKSNIPYVSGNIILYNGGVQYGEKLPITSNPMIIPRASLPSMDLTWAVELTAESNMFVGELTNASAGIYNFYLPQGVAVDNSPESSWFGHIYITQPVNGASDGMTTRTKNQQGGLFVYDPQLNELNPTNQGYSMGVAPVTGRNDFKRVNVDAQGNVYVNSTNAIYKASPENMTTSTAIGSGLFTTINSFALTGADDNLQFCIMDNANTPNGGTMKTMVAPFAETNTLLQSAKFGNADNAIVSDGFGGWWVVQNRYSADAYNVLSHVTAGGVIDYAINNTSNSTLAPSEPVSYRGVLALNRVGTLLAIGGGNAVALYDVNYNGTDAPVLTKSSITLPTLGQNIDGVAFDYAGNLYVVSAKTERFYAFSLPTDNNTCEVPAKSTLVLNQYNTINLDETATNSTLINSNNGVTVNVTFNRRFTVADGWYTLVLPFDLTAAQMAEAFGADYRLCELETSYLKSETMMYLRFRDVDDLEAGKPYLFKTGVDITDDIVFNAVTINNATPQVVTDKVTMIGLYDQTVVGASDLNYYLGYEDYLYEYLTDKTTKAFRCYFHFASPSLIQGRNARVIFRDDVTTDLEDETFETAPAVQKIIRNGQLIIIRDGIEYNAQGQVVK